MMGPFILLNDETDQNKTFSCSCISEMLCVYISEEAPCQGSRGIPSIITTVFKEFNYTWELLDRDFAWLLLHLPQRASQEKGKLNS